MSDTQPTRPNNQEIRTETQRFWKKLLLGGLVCLCLLGFAAWICLFRDIPLEISPETTYITEPLTSDGKQVDYFRAIELERYPPTMKTDENGFRMIIRAIGVSEESARRSYATAQIYEKLGLDPTVPPTMTFEDPHAFIERYVYSLPQEDLGPEMGMGTPDPILDKKEELEEKILHPWTAEELPMMAEWLQANEAAIDLIVKAARQPSFVIPLARENEDDLLIMTPLPELQRLRVFARALATRANYHIAQGNFEKAIDDIIACKTMGRHAGHNDFMVEHIVGIALENIASEIGIAASLKHQPIKAQLQRLLDIYTQTPNSKIPPREDFQKTLIIDRYGGLDTAQKFHTMSIAEKRETMGTYHERANILYILSYFGSNWNTFMKSVNHAYDRSGSLDIMFPSLSPNLLFPNGRSEFYGKLFVSVYGFRNYAFFEAVNRAKRRDRLQAITLAMLIYEKEHGHLPPAWTVDSQGKPLHSWRVLLLPYLGEETKKLYGKIRLDEPWDSKHNQQFHEVADTTYRSAYDDAKVGETHYAVMVGPKTAFRGEQGVKLDALGTNYRNLALVLECENAVNWMDPKSDPTAATATHKILKENYLYHLGFRDGSVRQLDSSNFSETPMESYITIQDLTEGTVEMIPD